MKGPGRPSIGLERMLCIHFLPYAFNLADPAVEDTLYDSCAVRAFVGIDLGQRLFAALGSHVRDQSLKIGIGTIVDATILSASPRHQAGVRFHEDAPPACTKNANWFFRGPVH